MSDEGSKYVPFICVIGDEHYSFGQRVRVRVKGGQVRIGQLESWTDYIPDRSITLSIVSAVGSHNERILVTDIVQMSSADSSPQGVAEGDDPLDETVVYDVRWRN